MKKPPTVQVTLELRRWWLARYSLEEIRELASEAFGGGEDLVVEQ